MELADGWDVWVAGEGTMKSHLSDELELAALDELPLIESVRQTNKLIYEIIKNVYT